MDNRPIGVFDSGLGGLTVLKEIRRLLPEESIIYFGDNGRTPYGTKSRETVIKYTGQDVAFLLSKNVKLLVVACNTVSALALSEVKQAIGIPVLEVIGPGSNSAVRKSRNGRIGVIGTPATIASGAYTRAILSRNPDVKIFTKACPLFVSLVEEGWWDNKIAEMVANEYLQELKKENIDTIVLGCTHYPLLSKTIGKVMGDDVVQVSSAEELALALKELLLRQNLSASAKAAKYQYYTSDSVEKFKELGKLILEAEIDNVERVDLDV
jgi:glutamate racemase